MIKNKRLRFTNVQWRTCRTAIKLVHNCNRAVYNHEYIVSEMCLRDQTVVSDVLVHVILGLLRTVHY